MAMTRGMLMLAVALALGASVRAAAADGDVEAVKAVVKSAYVDGVHVRGDAALMRAGFHPGFRMLVLKDGALTPVTLDDWAGRIEKGAAERKGPPPEIRHEFTRVDVTGDAAAVRLELHRGGKHTFTDHLSLYRFPDGWKIVSKIFQAHPAR
jgi:hypothetical protein